METITINVDEDLAEAFRQKAETKFGKKKGYLAKAVSEAFTYWVHEQKDLVSKAFDLMDKGIKAENWKYKKRSEIYE